MANRNRINRRDDPDTLNLPELLPSHKNRSTENKDDLIVTLSDAYENRRARQVGEWEQLYTENVYRAS